MRERAQTPMGRVAIGLVATLALIAINVAIHLVAWPMQKTAMQYEAGAMVRLAEMGAIIAPPAYRPTELSTRATPSIVDS